MVTQSSQRRCLVLAAVLGLAGPSRDGSSTVAATASMGLLHRYGRITPKKPIGTIVPP